MLGAFQPNCRPFHYFSRTFENTIKFQGYLRPAGFPGPCGIPMFCGSCFCFQFKQLTPLQIKLNFLLTQISYLSIPGNVFKCTGYIDLEIMIIRCDKINQSFIFVRIQWSSTSISSCSLNLLMEPLTRIRSPISKPSSFVSWEAVWSWFHFSWRDEGSCAWNWKLSGKEIRHGVDLDWTSDQAVVAIEDPQDAINGLIFWVSGNYWNYFESLYNKNGIAKFFIKFPMVVKMILKNFKPTAWNCRTKQKILFNHPFWGNVSNSKKLWTKHFDTK